jgi:tRNA threonylcarbamoyladenosine biosynthesis protein TsaE
VAVSVALAAADDTRDFGIELADLLRAGDLVILNGPLGAGKTVLVQGIAAGLEVPGRVVSPTFVIARVHHGGRLPLVHVDAYRLSSMVEVDDLDLDVDVDAAVTAVEWGAGLVEQLAGSWLLVELERAPDSDERRVTLTGHGGDWDSRLHALGVEAPTSR